MSIKKFLSLSIALLLATSSVPLLAMENAPETTEQETPPQTQEPTPPQQNAPQQGKKKWATPSKQNVVVFAGGAAAGAVAVGAIAALLATAYKFRAQIKQSLHRAKNKAEQVLFKKQIREVDAQIEQLEHQKMKLTADAE